MASAVLSLEQASLDAQTPSDKSTQTWYDLRALGSAGAIWAGLNSYFELQNGSTGSQLTESVEKVNAIEERLHEACLQVSNLLHHTISLAEFTAAWFQQYPNPPSGDKLAQTIANIHLEKSIKSCQKAESTAAQATTTLFEVNRRAWDLQRYFDFQIDECQRKIESAQAAAASETQNPQPPVWVVTGGPLVLLKWVTERKREISDNLIVTLREPNVTLTSITKMKEGGVTFDSHLIPWMEMVQNISQSLDSIHRMLQDAQGSSIENTALHLQLRKIDWSQIAQCSKDVFRIIQSKYSGAQSLAPDFQDAIVNVWHTDAIEQEVKVQDPNKEALTAAFSPDTHLASILSSQTKECKEIYQQVDDVLQSPVLRDIVDHGDNTQTPKVALSDVAMKLRQQYVKIISMEYDTIQQLYSISVLQSRRIEHLQQGRIQLKVLLNNTLASVQMALEPAQRTLAKFKDAASELGETNKVDEILAKIQSIGTKFATGDEALRDQITKEIAEVVTTNFMTGATLFDSGAPDPICQRLALHMNIKVPIEMMSQGLKHTLDKLSHEDLEKTIEALKSVASDLNSSQNRLAALRLPFINVVAGMQRLTASVGDMETALQSVKEKIELFNNISLSKDDVSNISKGWDAVRDGCDGWMDMFNRQGISPLTFSYEQ
ncbi:uncharacterized protein N7511_010034 [Penicillium nucicola]|uniref:uncharacterized protein n=1 Tax=Penicillium nucicola TaxID=1850975 RepID=UPI002545AF2B|nr:uncharacterized protein N7511_010034 [Penicillium nucicola]KAJ5748338.1 hypothetical protein N7511_010034 [Penicillium nucicola]